jgi:hypothetical protein
MLRLAAALIAAVFLTAQAPIQVAPSQPPRTNSEVNQAASAKDNSTGDQHDAAPAPVVIKIQNTNNGRGESDPRGDEQPNKRPEGWTLGDKIAGIASLVAFLQFLALITTVAVMIYAARRQLRAYVTVDSVSIQPVLGGWNSTVVLKNSGGTPAKDVESWCEIDIKVLPLPTGTRLVATAAWMLPTGRSVIASQGPTTLCSGIQSAATAPSLATIRHLFAPPPMSKTYQKYRLCWQPGTGFAHARATDSVLR